MGKKLRIILLFAILFVSNIISAQTVATMNMYALPSQSWEIIGPSFYLSGTGGLSGINLPATGNYNTNGYFLLWEVYPYSGYSSTPSSGGSTSSSFTLSNTIAATVTTQAVSAISTATATGNGNVTDLGAPNPTQHGVCWNTAGTPSISDDKTIQGFVSTTGAFTSDITGLNANTTYYVKAYVTNNAGTSYGAEVNFATLPEGSAVTTQAVSSIALTTATGNGNVTDLGAPNPTQHGVCWNTAGTPSISDDKTEEGSVSTTGAFTSDITGLIINTTYYVRAYATNNAGTSYGTEVNFVTISTPTTQTTDIIFSNVESTQLGLSWVSGSGSKRAVFITEITNNKTAAAPVDGTTYNPNAIYGNGSQIGASGWYCVYNGTGTEVTITGLTPNTNYKAMVCEYNGQAGGEFYNSTTATNNPNSITSVPLSDWAMYLGIILIAMFMFDGYRKRLFA
ncbi:MAG: hypothetical protein HQ521_05705 [Bacteroidetes bacterium]|nr:hypothetical protein [Bacteroidota bacterium]